MSRIAPLILFVLSLMACGAPVETSHDEFVPEVTERGTFRLRIALDEGSFRRGVNPMTVWAETADGARAELVEVRARMPGHAHAEDRPTVRPGPDGWRVEDLEMTMPGRWIITFRIAHGGTQDEALAITSLR